MLPRMLLAAALLPPVSLPAAVTAPVILSKIPLEQVLDEMAESNETTDEQSAADPKPEASPPKNKAKRYVCKTCNANEQRVLEILQDRGITDPAALAVMMGNIKQESKFHPNICEGGARVNYEHCHRGGFGLLQWTTVGRYQGLGRHARSMGMSPTSLEAQMSWLFTEVEFKKIEHILKTPGHSIDKYMRASYRWIGWGVHGARTAYAHEYYNKFTF